MIVSFVCGIDLPTMLMNNLRLRGIGSGEIDYSRHVYSMIVEELARTRGKHELLNDNED